MYVCICNAISDKKVRSLIQSGVRTSAEAFKALGKKPQCGRCAADIARLVTEPGALPLMEQAI